MAAPPPEKEKAKKAPAQPASQARKADGASGAPAAKRSKQDDSSPPVRSPRGSLFCVVPSLAPSHASLAPQVPDQRRSSAPLPTPQPSAAAAGWDGARRGSLPGGPTPSVTALTEASADEERSPAAAAATESRPRPERDFAALRRQAMDKIGAGVCVFGLSPSTPQHGQPVSLSLHSRETQRSNRPMHRCLP